MNKIKSFQYLVDARNESISFKHRIICMSVHNDYIWVATEYRLYKIHPDSLKTVSKKV